MAAVAVNKSFSPLGRALVQQGKLLQADANAIQIEASKAGISFIEQLTATKKLTPREVALFAAATFGMPLVDLGVIDIEGLPIALIDAKTVASRRVIPLFKRGNRLSVAMSDPSNEQILQEIKFAIGIAIDPVVVEDDKLSLLVKKFSETGAQSLDKMMGDDAIDLDSVLGIAGEEEATETTEDIDDAPVVKYVTKVLLDAINGGASDIHFEPYEKFYRIRYRTDGIET